MRDDLVEKVARAICASDFDGDKTVFDTMSSEMQANFIHNAGAVIPLLAEEHLRAAKNAILRLPQEDRENGDICHDAIAAAIRTAGGA